MTAVPDLPSHGLLSQAFLAALVAGSVTSAVPLMLAGLGEQMSEKAGVLNIGIEGMMLLGAYAGFAVAFGSGSMWLGFLAGAGAGLCVASVMALCCVRLGLNQVVIGIALTLAVEGLTSLLQFFQFSRTYPRLPEAPTLALPVLSRIPVIGPGVFDRHPLAYLAVLLAVAFGLVYRHLHFGLDLAAAGDAPAALDAAGVDVAATRTAAVLVTGALAGLGGAYLSEIGSGVFVPFMTNGAGFISIVLAMLARGAPLGVVAGALLFGGALSLTTALQVAGIDVPTDAIQMLPFVLVMVALVLVGRRARHAGSGLPGAGLPKALGVPYLRGLR